MTGPAAAPSCPDVSGGGRTGGPLIDLRGVVKRRGGDRGFELRIGRIEIRPQQALAFVGPSGCGKSTLIDLLAMTLKPDEAERFVLADPACGADIDVAALWRRGRQDALGRLRARRFGYVVQTGGLLPFLTVRANIALPQQVLGRPEPEEIRALAERLGIAGKLGEYPARLSVGQRQRVAIARALAHRPAIVLADEPTASLDPANAEAVMRLFTGLVAGSGAALVLVTHDAGLARRFGIPVVRAEFETAGPVSRTVFDMAGRAAPATPEPDGTSGREAAPPALAGTP